MKPPRFSEGATSPGERVIALAASVESAPLSTRGWDVVMARAVTARPTNLKLVSLFMLSAAAGAALVLLAQPTPVTPVVSVVHATAGSRWSSTSPQEVTLQSGRLSVTIPSGAPLRIRTPDAELEVSRSRFLAEVVTNGTSVWVEEGEVVLRAGGVVRVIHAGESITWPPNLVIPAPLLEAAPASDSHCAALAGAEIRTCLRSEASGASLAAQVALYELGNFEVKQGQLDAGLEVWRESLARCPRGVLEPEVRLSLLIAMVKARRFSDARLAAQDFEAHCSGDPRIVDVRALQRALPQ